MRRIISAFMTLIFLFIFAACAETAEAGLAESDLNAASAVLIDAASGSVFFSKNDRVRMNPASTTKILTLLLGIESGIPLDQVIAIPQAAADIPKDSTLIPVYPGDRMTFGDLLLGFSMNSGNDGANAIAVIVSGSINGFVDLMNRRAAELGCTGTHFSNPHGYTDSNHYTTAYDLALITAEALKNDTFRQIVGAKTAVINISGRDPLKLRTQYMTMREDSPYFYDGCIGVKTGTTKAAGKCFVGAAEKNGVTVISVVLGCDEDENRWKDTDRLFDHAWTCYDVYSFADIYRAAAPRMMNLAVSNAAADDYAGGALDLNIAQISSDSYIRMVEKNSVPALEEAVNEFTSRCSVEVTRALTAPVSCGEIMGTITYYEPSGGQITAKLVAARDIEERAVEKTITDYLPFLTYFSNPIFLALVITLALLIILIIILIAAKRAERERRRRRIYERRRREYLEKRRRAGAISAGRPGGSPDRNRQRAGNRRTGR